ncbi:MAG: hypothetical protein AAF368_01125 [Planctomycetota bacterium]
MKTSSPLLRLASLLALGGLAWGLPSSFPCEAATLQDEPKEKPVEKPIERLTEWPAVEDKAALKKDVARLRKAHTEEMGTQAREALIAAGAAAGPALLFALEKEKNDDARDRVVEVLEAICDARHTRLLAAEFGSKSDRVRLFCLNRVALFPDAGVHEEAKGVYDKLLKKKDKADAKEKYAAALCIASAGDPVGLDVLLAAAGKHWKKRGAALRAATVALRGNPESIALLTPHLGADAERNDKLAALRLLATIGDSTVAKAYLPALLDQNDNSLRIGAINACRGIFDGAPPLDKLPVFEAIEKAKQWKARL